MFDRLVNSSIPPQQVKYSVKFEKDKDENNVTKWQKDTVDALESLARYHLYNNTEIRKNYEIMQGRFNLEDYVDSFDAYDITSIIYEQMKLPSFMKHYDITTKAVKLLLGEYVKRPDITFVLAEDSMSTNEKLRAKDDLVHSYLQQEVQKEVFAKMAQMGIDPNKSDFKTQEEADQYKQEIQQKYQELTPESIDKYMTYDFRTAGESWGQAVLLNDKRRFNMAELDQIEFYDMLVADRCYSHIYLTAEGYNIEVWNPRDVFHEYSSDLRYVEDGMYVGRLLYISKPQIIDLFGYRMTLEQIEALYPQDHDNLSTRGGSIYNDFFSGTLYPFADYQEYANISEAVGQGMNSSGQLTPFGAPFNMSPNNGYFFNQPDTVQVTQVYWKSQRKVGKLNFQNPNTGKIEVQMVDETFDPKLFDIEVVKESYKDSDEPNTISWTWITQTWQGVKINVNYEKSQSPGTRSAIYVDVRPTDFQFKGNNPKLQFKCKLPVVGQIFNNRNGKSQSVVDLLKPYQVFHNAFMNQAYFTTQKNNGKSILMGASLLPTIKDLGGEESMEKFMTMAANIGLSVVDDSPNAARESMQYGLKVLDMDESERITRSINCAILVEQQGFLQLGISPQRQGTIQASETATGTNAAVNNSYAITEIYFEQYSHYRRRKFQMLLDIAQYCALREDDIVLQSITSDIGQSFIKINANDLLLRDLGIYVSNSGEMYRKKQVIEQLILKNNQNLIPFSQLIDIVMQDNLSDVKKSLQDFEKKQQENAQATQQAEQKAIQDKLQAEMQEHDKERNWKSQENQADRENKIYLEEIKQIGAEGSFSQTENLVPDVIDQAKLSLEQSRHQFDISARTRELALKTTDVLSKHKLEKDKIEASKSIANKQNSLKEKEIKNRLQVENKKLETVKVQNASQEKLSLLKHKADKEMADKKLQLEKTKLRIKPKTTKK